MALDANDIAREHGVDGLRAAWDRCAYQPEVRAARAARGNGEDEAAPDWSAADATAETSSEEVVGGLGEWDAGDEDWIIAPRGWLLSNVFCRGFLSSLIAGGGTGKTVVRHAQGLSLATGRPLTGEYVFQRCRVLIVSLEDGKDELRRRILAAMRHHNIAPADVAGWLFLASPSLDAGKLIELDERGRLARGKLGDRIKRAVVDRGIDVVIIDPLVKTHSVQENDNSAMDHVAALLTDMAVELNIAVDVPHHVSKGAPDPGNADRGRGASSVKDAGRLVYTLTPMSADEAKAFGTEESERRSFVRMDSAKVNIAPHTADAKWFRLVGVPLDNATEDYPAGDTVQTVEPWTPPDTWAGLGNELLNRILTEIDGGLSDGNRYSDAPRVADRAAWRVVERHTQKTEEQCREIIRAWVRSGLLERRNYENPVTRKTVLGLYVNDANRPGTNLA